MSVPSECFMLSGRGLYDVLITRQCVVCLIVCDQETSRMMWPRPDLGRCVTKILQDCSETLKENDSSKDREANSKKILKQI